MVAVADFLEYLLSSFTGEGCSTATVNLYLVAGLRPVIVQKPSGPVEVVFVLPEITFPLESKASALIR